MCLFVFSGWWCSAVGTDPAAIQYFSYKNLTRETLTSTGQTVGLEHSSTVVAHQIRQLSQPASIKQSTCSGSRPDSLKMTIDYDEVLRDIGELGTKSHPFPELCVAVI